MKTFTSQAANIEQNVALTNIFWWTYQRAAEQPYAGKTKTIRNIFGGMFMCLFEWKLQKGAVANSYLGWYKTEKSSQKEVARKLDRFPQWIFWISISKTIWHWTSPFVKYKLAFLPEPLKNQVLMEC